MALGFLMGWIFIGLVVCMCPVTVLWMCLCKPGELDPESLPRFVDEASNGLKRESKWPAFIMFFHHYAVRITLVLLLLWYEDLSMAGWKITPYQQGIILCIVTPLLFLPYLVWKQYDSFFEYAVNLLVYMPIGLLYFLPIIYTEGHSSAWPWRWYGNFLINCAPMNNYHAP